MVKGSRSRKCRFCGKIVGWMIPIKNCGLFMECDFRPTKDFAHDGKGYICKDCKAKQTDK